MNQSFRKKLTTYLTKKRNHKTKNEYDKEQHTTTTKLQATDEEQTNTDLGGIKHVC